MAAPSDSRLAEFKRERNAALLSLDAEAIYDFAKKWGAEIVVRASQQGREKLFWTSVHKARANCTDLPAEAREQSAGWLTARGFSTAA